MRAIILATGNDAQSEHPSSGLAPMMPLMDRPFLRHVVENLIDVGTDEIDLILSHLPQLVESYFGSGARWGISIHYHLARDPNHAVRAIKRIAFATADEPILLAWGDRLQDRESLEGVSHTRMPVAFYWEAPGSGESPVPERKPSGWFLMTAGYLSSLDTAMTVDELEECCWRDAKADGALEPIHRPLCVRTYAELLDSQRRVLGKEFRDLLTDSWEVEKGIWLSRNVVLPTSAEITPPVHIGEDVRVGKDVKLGPNVVIGAGSILDDGCTVQNALVCPGSFIGPGLELRDAVVEKARLVNVRLDTVSTVSERFLVGLIKGHGALHVVSSVFSRIVAACLLVVGWPLKYITALHLQRRLTKPARVEIPFVPLPANDDPATWNETHYTVLRTADEEDVKSRFPGFFTDLLPALPAIVRGRLHVVGVRPRSTAELFDLEPGHRSLIIQSKPGLITEACIQFGPKATLDEIYAAEAYYSVNASVAHDFQILFKWAARSLMWNRLHGPRHMPPAKQPKEAKMKGETLEAAGEEARHWSLQTTSRMDAIDEICEFIDKVHGEIHGNVPDEHGLFRLKVATVEILTNIIEHAYESRSDQPLWVHAEAIGDELKIRLRHQGKAFDPTVVAPPAFDGTRERGFGMYIVSKYVDGVEYAFEEEGIHSVILTSRTTKGLENASDY